MTNQRVVVVIVFVSRQISSLLEDPRLAQGEEARQLDIEWGLQVLRNVSTCRHLSFLLQVTVPCPEQAGVILLQLHTDHLPYKPPYKPSNALANPIPQG